jgi:hypothetical protein
MAKARKHRNCLWDVRFAGFGKPGNETYIPRFGTVGHRAGLGVRIGTEGPDSRILGIVWRPMKEKSCPLSSRSTANDRRETCEIESTRKEAHTFNRLRSIQSGLVRRSSWSFFFSRWSIVAIARTHLRNGFTFFAVEVR